ncbi:MAG: hypothetical protein ACTH6I_10330 [Vibrio litoralis]|uniref:hypothetical protein n=1 Tax=Vibrio litoralis TaxID=335972 RepID=UPI003F9DA68F
MSMKSYSFVPRKSRETIGKQLAKRNGHRCWSDDDLISLISLYESGLSTLKIAALLSRTENAVRLKLSRMGHCNRYESYTVQDDFYIRRYYGFKPLFEIALHLDVSVSSLVDRATKKLNLKDRYCGENSRTCKFTDDDIELIRTLRDEGLSVVDISEKFEASKSYISRVLNYKARTKPTCTR